MKEQIGELRIDEAIIPIIKGDLRFHLIIVLKVFLKISLDSKRVKIDGFLLYIVLIFLNANVKITKFKCTFPVVSDFFIKINIFLVNFYFF